MTAALPMGGQKITGMADPTVSTDAATKNYVDTTTAAFFSTGDVKMTLKVVADTGWIMFDDNNFGSSASGSSHASDANQALFLLLFANINDTWAPLLTSTGAATTRAAQGTAAAAWAANCRMYLPRTLCRTLAISGSGSGISSKVLGQFTGAETQSLATGNLPPYTPSGTITNGTITATPLVSGTTAVAGNTSQAITPSGATPVVGGTVGTLTVSMSQAASTFTGTAQGGTSAAFGIMNPTAYLNAMVKI